MDDKGYTKISDLGLATKVDPKKGASGLCGTRGYWAPEMMKRDADGNRKRYTLSVDWFSFGCCIYEFLCGTSPFRVDAVMTTNITNNKERDAAIDKATEEMTPIFDDNFDEKTKEFILRLLDKDGVTRLGGAGGQREIATHPWFKSIDWRLLETQQPPFVPNKDTINLRSQDDIGEFNDEKGNNIFILFCYSYSYHLIFFYTAIDYYITVAELKAARTRRLSISGDTPFTKLENNWDFTANKVSALVY